MAEQIILNIVRPEVGIAYVAESPEAELGDRRSAAILDIHALGRHICEISDRLGQNCPVEIRNLVASDLWRTELGRRDEETD